MDKLEELTVTIRRIEVCAVSKSASGIPRAELLLTERSEGVVTDRIVIGEKSVRVLGLRR